LLREIAFFRRNFSRMRSAAHSLDLSLSGAVGKVRHCSLAQLVCFLMRQRELFWLFGRQFTGLQNRLNTSLVIGCNRFKQHLIVTQQARDAGAAQPICVVANLQAQLPLRNYP